MGQWLILKNTCLQNSQKRHQMQSTKKHLSKIIFPSKERTLAVLAEEDTILNSKDFNL